MLLDVAARRPTPRKPLIYPRRVRRVVDCSESVIAAKDTFAQSFVIPANAGIHPSLNLGADRMLPVVPKPGWILQRPPNAGIHR